MRVIMLWRSFLCKEESQYVFELLHNSVYGYCTYDKELYTFMQAVNKWKHHLLGKETILHMDHQSLQTSTSMLLQVDGVSAAVSIGNKVQKRCHEQAGGHVVKTAYNSSSVHNFFP